MSEIEKQVSSVARKVIKLMELDLKISSLKIYKVEESDYLGELHKPIEKIEEFEPGTEIFVEIAVEKKEVGKCRLIIKGRVDESGNIDFVHSEMPLVPTSPGSTEKDKKLKEKISEFFEKWEKYLSSVFNAVLNIAVAVIKKYAGLG